MVIAINESASPALYTLLAQEELYVSIHISTEMP